MAAMYLHRCQTIASGKYAAKQRIPPLLPVITQVPDIRIRRGVPSLPT